MAQARPQSRVIGVDGDPQLQALARRKPGAHAVDWHEGLAGNLPLPDASADAVTMSLLLHHLDPDGKRAALAEAVRVLRPGGRLHIADFGRPADPLMHAAFFAVRLFDGFVPTADHVAGRLPDFLSTAGFTEVHRYRRLRTAGGSLELLSAVTPTR